MAIATRAPRRATPDPVRADRAVAQALAEASSPMPVILEARDLTKSYPLGSTIVEALRGVSLTVQAGEFVALMGPSGSGKSTLLQVLGGLDQPTTGEVILEGETISQLSDDQATRLRRDRTGFVFQSFNLIPLLDASENVALPFTIAGEDPTRGELRERVRDVIGLVDLTGKEHHKPDQLSAGEQQRVAIARALVTRPALLFADEPTGNLDYTTGTEILDALWRSCVERGQTIVLVTHDSKAAAYADRVLVIGDGRIRETIELGRRDIARRHAADRPARQARPVGRLRCRSTGSPSAACAPVPLRAGAEHRSASRSGSPSCSPGWPPTPASTRRSGAPSATWSAGPTCASPPSARPACRPRPSRPSPGRRASRSPRRPSSAGPTSGADLGRRRRPPAAGHGPGHRPGGRRPSSTTSPSSPARRCAIRPSTSALITERLAAEDGLAVGSPLTIQGAGDGITYRVVGIIAGDGPLTGAFGRTVVVPLRDRPGRLRRDAASPASTSAWPTGRPPRPCPPRSRRASTAEPYVLSTPPDLAASLRASTTDFQATTALIAAIALFAGAFLIFNTLSMTVAERIREVGLLRAAGASRGQVMSFMLTQALALGVIGSLIGLVARRSSSRSAMVAFVGTVGSVTLERPAVPLDARR